MVGRQNFRCSKVDRAHALGAQLEAVYRDAHRAAPGSTPLFEPQRPSWARQTLRGGHNDSSTKVGGRRAMTTPGLHELHWYILATVRAVSLGSSPGRHASSSACMLHVASRDSDHATYGCRDVTDGAPWSSVEAQGARSTSSGGAQSLYVVSIYPYHV